MSEYIVGFSTTDQEEEARKIASALVEEGLAAGVNILHNLASIYRWKGKICDKKEFLLIINTIDKNRDKIKKRLKEIHHYETPELVFLPITDGLPDYLAWLKSGQ